MTENPDVISVEPELVSVDEMNERTSDPDISDELIASVNETGVVQPPLVRETDEERYTVVIGQRRVRAALAAENVSEIPVVVMDYSDHEALKASITENIGLFRNSVPPKDRADALQTLWEQMGGGGAPVNSHLGKELGVPRETIRTWLEPLHDDWEGTTIDPRSDNDDSDDDFFTGNSLGERSLAEVRRMTGGGDEGEQVAREAAENDLTQPEIQEAKELVKESDADPYEAIRQMADEEDDSTQTDNTPTTDSSETSGDNRRSTPTIRAEVTFDSTSSIGLRQYANRTDQDPSEVVAEAVHWFLDAEGELPDEDPVQSDTTPGVSDGEQPSTGVNTDENDERDDGAEVTTRPASDLL